MDHFQLLRNVNAARTAYEIAARQERRAATDGWNPRGAYMNYDQCVRSRAAAHKRFHKARDVFLDATRYHLHHVFSTGDIVVNRLGGSRWGTVVETEKTTYSQWVYVDWHDGNRPIPLAPQYLRFIG